MQVWALFLGDGYEGASFVDLFEDEGDAMAEAARLHAEDVAREREQYDAHAGWPEWLRDRRLRVSLTWADGVARTRLDGSGDCYEVELRPVRPKGG